MKRFLSLLISLALLTPLAAAASFADDVPAENYYEFELNGCDVEFDNARLNESLARFVASSLAYSDPDENGKVADGTEKVLETRVETGINPGTDGATDIETHTHAGPGDPGFPFEPQGEGDLSAPCPADSAAIQSVGKHDAVKTVAYMTKHKVYASDPRCVVYTFRVTVCRKCGAMEKVLLSTERVSYCHPTLSVSVPGGDANGDGKVNARDVVTVMRKIAGSLPANAKFVFAEADVDMNNIINSRDVVKLMKKILKK